MDKEILKKVYDLAKIRHISYSSEEGSNCSVSLAEGIDVKYNRKEESELFQYLDSLTYEQNLMILTIAYIGRGDCYEEFERHKDIQKIYTDMLDYVRETFPNNEVTILQIHQKAPLDEYLKKGFELLEIEM